MVYKVTALLCLVPWLAWAAGEEQRCLDINAAGATCVCSETLDVNDTISGLTHNPSNSTTSQCGTAGLFLTDAQGDSVTFGLASAADGALLPGVTRVFTIDNPSGAAICGTMPARTWTNTSYCARFYMMIDASSAFPCGNEGCDPGCGGDCGRIKMPRWEDGDAGPHPGYQSGTDNGCDGVSDCGFQWSPLGFGSSTFGTGANLDGLGAITVGDFKGDWVRIEHCWDHWTSGTLANKLQTRVRLTRITGAGAPEEATDSHISPNTSATIATSFNGGGDSKSPMVFCSAPSLLEPIIEYHSYALVAIFPSTSACAADVNDCDWIGAATEIEGGAPPATPGSQGSGSFSISDLARDLFRIHEPFKPWADKREALAWARAQ